ncbi:MAG: hypothetical protein A2268_16765 [Candidatus Raymondbacteria bacterium RifOxyA12_full_50_37]|uniref:Xylose isomerase-like TIM barrel domain-containing protein n=1 Tax=Candidatus Raymondbacteria bacterium RIFOXYD12_FULL_49_13 TaxID=1817890 RepID=A0A1F7FD21_UNCRA|nr:MAG: hypothetical protein A2268_16765 [Candidatus Raymondbacteria bacterium RifOxyA12_full_50_37]OGJ86262.1 MAG: hypothetical protein A2248_16360 [Candidatus Raymondbacteria bacterium RIFOXYA2_FULL_49_16]OGJ94760.1 MAG: hypothetical protein A2350_19215 [Candidatus Raymondbacteria bacterium RifOxyB12_full_50_8]OGJ95799.1 MAG: hypothetical protein A2453_11675 [Candidatus Raymondbacteria bacterium RIFOXYC2_FULL_50_21]OGK04367.1 MAG: hypothetical protein A2519_18335 [Candidatus Raymondbacteria b
MKSYPTSVQLYSVREEAKLDFPATLKKIASMGFVAVEFAGYHNVPLKELRKILDTLSLKASSTHGALPDESNIRDIAEAAHTLGFTRHICGRGDAFFASEEECKKTAALLENAAQMLKKEGLTFGYHNHWWEFDKNFNGKLPMEVVAENAPSMFLQVDTYWVKVAGQEPSDFIKKYKARIPTLHIKDGPLNRDLPMTAVGEGKMNWKPIIEAADPATLEYLVVELDRCGTDMGEAVKKSISYLVKQGYGRSR